jgi:hypothetical protein
MAGLLDNFFGNADQTQALGLLGAGLMKRDFGGGAMAAMQHMAGAKNRAMEEQYMQAKLGLLGAQVDETKAQAEERRIKAKRDQDELERSTRLRQAIPGLFQAPGMAGGAPAPQMQGGQPMFSQPMGVTPMQQAPGGFNVQEALRLGMTPEQISAYAGLANVGRPKATRQMEVDDGRGGKRIALVDDFGQEVAGFAGYTAPVQVNQGDRVSFVKPAPGVSLGVNMSPAERDASGRGWATVAQGNARLGLDQQRFALEQGNMVADAGGPSQVALVKQFGKPSKDYRWKPDGTQEAIPGGPADIKSGELGAKAAARQETAIAQADSVLGEVRDAKKLVGWNTAGVGGVSQFIPATDGRNLAAKMLTIKANLGFDRLQQMRDQSPTGGALGQVAVQELASLQATVASLDQLQSPAQLGQALDKIEKHYTNWRNTVDQARKGGTGGASGGWQIREKR